MSATNSTAASFASPEVSSSILSSATSKLVPATAPAVSPWGNNSTSSYSDGAKRNWQANENATAKEPPLGVNTLTKEKATPTPKVKSTGKEKWIKYDAEIIISSTTGTNSQNKKKNNNSGNSGNNNNGNGNNNTGKKKQNNNNNKNQNHKKDPKHKKQHNDNKNQNNNNNNNNNNSSEKKKNNGNDRKAEAKASDYGINKVTDIVAELSIENKASKEETLSPSTKAAVIGIVKVESGSSDALDTKSVSNGESSTEHNGEFKLSDSQEKSSAVNGNPNGYKKNNFQHRNSESYAPGSHNGTTHKRRYNSSNKGFNPRHSFGGFNSMPVMNPGFNNYYIPMMPNMYGFNQFANSFVPPHPPTGHGSRSNSHSPAKDDFVPLNNQPSMGPMITDANAIPQFIPHQMMYNPYPQDLNSLILETVSYYFSDVNLAKDIFLRRHMNSNGFVPLDVLIGFNKLKSLTGGDMNLLLSALGNYPELEVSNGKVRRAHNWQLWIIAYEKRLPVGQQEDDDGISQKENKETAFPQDS